MSLQLLKLFPNDHIKKSQPISVKSQIQIQLSIEPKIHNIMKLQKVCSLIYKGLIVYGNLMNEI
jgi:hypothetical protein